MDTRPPEQLDCPIDSLGNGDVSADHAVDDLPDVRAASDCGATTARPVAENDVGMAPTSQSLVDEFLDQC